MPIGCACHLVASLVTACSVWLISGSYYVSIWLVSGLLIFGFYLVEACSTAQCLALHKSWTCDT